MPNGSAPPDPVDRRCLDVLRRAGSWFVIALSSVTPASAQDASHRDLDGASNGLAALYECASYYTVVNYCYSRDGGADSINISASAFRSRDKVIHLIFTRGKRAGILSETSQSEMLSSFNRMMKSIDNRCERIDRLTSDLKPSCDKIIEDVPQPPYDKGRRSGRLDRTMSASIR